MWITVYPGEKPERETLICRRFCRVTGYFDLSVLNSDYIYKYLQKLRHKAVILSLSLIVNSTNEKPDSEFYSDPVC